jgi:glycosyltransferase involved in cell wall biosynthesis
MPNSPHGTSDVSTRTPRVSVGVPVYNGENHLRETLDSLLAQNYPDFEIILSDNGSTDGTESICREFAARDSRVRYLREPQNRGAAWNYRRVYEAARGAYFRWSCHDDPTEPDHLGRLVETLDAAPPSVVLAYSRSIHVDGGGAMLGNEEVERLDTRGLAPHMRLRYLAQRLRHSSILYGLMRRNALEGTGLLGPFEGSDYVLCAELALKGEFQEIPDFLFYKRIHPGMSRQAQTTQQTVAQWFDTTSNRRFYVPRLRVMWGVARAVQHAPLGKVEKARALWAIPRYWGRRFWRLIVKELLATMIPSFRRYESWRRAVRTKILA